MAEVSGGAAARPQNRPQSLLALAHWSSAAGGVVIASQGLRRRDGLGALTALGGAALVAWGAAGALTRPQPRDLLRRSLLRVLSHTASEVKRAVTINRPREVLYAFWRDFANLAQLLPDVLEIRPVSGAGIGACAVPAA
jgi:uncharacterized membrane protein